MISNSRPVTQNIALGSAVMPSTRAADSYSDDLMDDLFLDVDRILDGDLSSYMTVVGHNPKPINPSTRTVQLPSNFVPRSTADIYRATVEATNTYASNYQPMPSAYPASVHPTSAHVTRAPKQLSEQPITHRTDYSSYSSGYGGGRPVTSARKSPASSGNFQTAVIQSPNEGIYGATVDTQALPVQSGANYQANYRANYGANYLYPHEPLPELSLAGVSPRPPQTIFEPQQPQQPVSLPFLLMGAASISAVSTLGLLVLSQSAPSSGWLLSLNQEAAAAELPDNSTEDFLAYLQQSLEVISDRQAKTNQTVSVIPVASNAPTLPTTVPNVNASPQLGALPNLPGAAIAPNVIERVFVPVYQNGQTGQSTQAAGKATAPVPAVTLPNNRAQRPTVPVPAPVAAAAAIPPGAPAAARASVPIVQPGGNSQLPTPSAIPNAIAVAPTNAAANITNTTPTSEHVLVGILNLGSRSAALFNIDGTSQRAYVGDHVGVSDWTLVSVNGQDVMVRRDGEVRSIYIGQRF